jgi:hypothetical protein
MDLMLMKKEQFALSRSVLLLSKEEGEEEEEGGRW